MPEAERAEALLDLLLRATDETLRHPPGFLSANFHVNLDRTQVVNTHSGGVARRLLRRAPTPESKRSYARPPRSPTASSRSTMSAGARSQAPARHDSAN